MFPCFIVIGFNIVNIVCKFARNFFFFFFLLNAVILVIYFM